MTTFKNAYNETLELTAEQEKCLNYHIEDNDTLMIKGYAGAGKSVVIQNYALKYINKYPEDKRKHKIGIFTFTNALTTTTCELLESNPGGKDIVTSTLDKYLAEVYNAMGGPHIKIYDGAIRFGNIEQALKIHEKEHEHHRFHDLGAEEFWNDEIEWMKMMNVSPNDKDYYLSLERRGRGSNVRMSQRDREVAFDIFCTYCKYIERKKCGHWSDYAIYINRRLKMYKNAIKQGIDIKNPIPMNCMFDFVMIDEAQDLSLAQMLAAMGLYKKGMLIAMDAHQRIYTANWTPKQLGIETKTEWLKKSMRNTIEIDALAESLRLKNEAYLGETNKEKRAIPQRSGDKPVIYRFNDSSEEKAFVIAQIKAYLSQSKEIRIGVIASKKKQVEKYSMWCSEAGIKHEIISKESTFSMKTPGVKILTAHGSKGLEFFRVIIPEFNEGKFPYGIKTDDPDEKELLLVQCRSIAYVAMTRAQQSLIITCSGKKPSRFINEMDSSLFTLIDKSSYKKIETSKSSGYQKNIKPVEKSMTPIQANESASDSETLIEYFQKCGFECIDKRGPNGGCLWVIGSKEELINVIREAKKKFGDLGNNNYSDHGGRATNHRGAWFMTSNK